ncbi:hypothetical protein Drose_19445 [Dactylosporangium roseum]|uniref:DUF8129 domain-containing protein n=1 Tax=Dactylosporangium roseum TaxID=47989 RepID=A0ABY5YUT8_9ACTN|nr:hypothetical protein [Dactylosporangium roseum]UWZ33491.1 hypothetical protein Drose_19445 [Dactylosporangium roseum]
MTTARQKVIEYLQDARAAEYALTALLAPTIALVPEGDYRRWLEFQRRRSRERAYQVSDRLGELGARRGLRHLGMGVVRVAGGQAVAMAEAPLQLLRGQDSEERVLKSTRDLCAATAVVDANYRALEQIAHTCRDETTARLAVDLRAESEVALSECFLALDRLAEAVVFGDSEGELVQQASRAGAVQMLQLPQLRESMYRLRDEAVDVLRSARGEAVRIEVRTINPDYDNLSVEQVLGWLTQLSQAELATVDAYERAARNRMPILEAIHDLQVREPWPEYDRMNVTAIRARLREADEEQIRSVLDYERTHKDRSSILNAPEAQVVVAV